MVEKIPLHVLTGFLGSGKTTLLNRLLREPAWADTAVLINEYGSVSIDHDLVERVDVGAAVDIITLKGGCTCCALRGDLVVALLELYARRVDGKVPPFSRVVLETTGLADPTPILFTLVQNPALRHKFARGVVVATFDVINGPMQFGRYLELRKQVTAADRVALTKTDIATEVASSAVIEMIRSLNPVADICNAGATADLFREGEIVLRDRPASFMAESSVAAKLGDRRLDREQPLVCEQVLPGEHSEEIESVAIQVDQPIDWAVFAIWLTMLVHAHGERLLRFKAILHLTDTASPVTLDAVHHLIYPPRHLSRWPSEKRASTLVFIGQGMALDRVERSLKAFLAIN